MIISRHVKLLFYSARWVVFQACRLLTFFSKLTFSKNSFRVSNNLDPSQDQHSMGPDSGSKLFERLSADDKSGH